MDMCKKIPDYLPKIPEVMAYFPAMEKKMTKNAFNSMELCNFAFSCYKKSP
jgi:hypothetical protein